MKIRNSDDNASLEQRNKRRREKSWWGITREDNNEACNPSFGTCSTNDIQSATNAFRNRSVREFAYCDTSGSYENRSEWGRTHRSWGYEKRYQGRSHRVCNYERQVDSRGSDPSVGISSSNITMPRKNSPRMWDYSGRCERRWNQRKWDYECQADNIVSDPSVDRYSAYEVLPVTNPRQMWDYDKRYQRRWNERVWNNKREVLPVKNSLGMWDHNVRYERKRNQRTWDNERQVDNRGSIPSLQRSSSNSILPMKNPPEKSDQEMRYERRKKQRMCDFERQVEDSGNVPSVGISAADSILSGANPSVNASVKTCTNFEPIVTQRVEVMEDNLMGEARISCGVGEAPRLSEVVKDETGVMVKENTISQLGDSSEEAHLMVKENTISQLGDSSEEAHLIVPRRKKLIILDVNGLLADFVPFFPRGYKPDTTISGKAVYKRPFCDDFLQFCFKQFEVGVWSSRARNNLNLVIDFLMGDLKHKLLFSWDQSHCTKTGFTTIENRSKPLVLKELRKIWEKLDPNLPCEKGEFNESNTVLLDDSPYKALRNPANTAIFPRSFCYSDLKDTSLGPGGDLRVYIEGLAMAENIQEYIKQNPFGQSPITELNPSWGYYRQIVHSGCGKKKGKKDTGTARPALKNK